MEVKVVYHGDEPAEFAECGPNQTGFADICIISACRCFETWFALTPVSTGLPALEAAAAAKDLSLLAPYLPYHEATHHADTDIIELTDKRGVVDSRGRVVSWTALTLPTDAFWGEMTRIAEVLRALVTE